MFLRLVYIVGLDLVGVVRIVRASKAIPPEINLAKQMKTATEWNLDDENEVSDFIETFGTMKGVALAHRLGLHGKGCARKANSLSNYAWNKHTAIGLRKDGQIQTAIQYEKICQRIYDSMDAALRW